MTLRSVVLIKLNADLQDNEDSPTVLYRCDCDHSPFSSTTMNATNAQPESSRIQTNPLIEDPVLSSLLKKLKKVHTQRSFDDWSDSFLARFVEFLDEEGTEKAEQAYWDFADSMSKLVRVINKLNDLIENGMISKEKCTVKAHQCLQELSRQITFIMDEVDKLIPQTMMLERECGYTKFHMGAVLVRDGFREYGRMSLAADVLEQMEEHLDGIADRQIIDNMKSYGFKLQAFCDVMADLSLFDAMVKCNELDDSNEDTELGRSWENSVASLATIPNDAAVTVAVPPELPDVVSSANRQTSAVALQPDEYPTTNETMFAIQPFAETTSRPYTDGPVSLLSESNTFASEEATEALVVKSVGRVRWGSKKKVLGEEDLKIAKLVKRDPARKMKDVSVLPNGLKLPPVEEAPSLKPKSSRRVAASVIELGPNDRVAQRKRTPKSKAHPVSSDVMNGVVKRDTSPNEPGCHSRVDLSTDIAANERGDAFSSLDDSFQILPPGNQNDASFSLDDSFQICPPHNHHDSSFSLNDSFQDEPKRRPKWSLKEFYKGTKHRLANTVRAIPRIKSARTGLKRPSEDSLSMVSGSDSGLNESAAASDVFEAPMTLAAENETGIVDAGGFGQRSQSGKLPARNTQRQSLGARNDQSQSEGEASEDVSESETVASISDEPVSEAWTFERKEPTHARDDGGKPRRRAVADFKKTSSKYQPVDSENKPRQAILESTAPHDTESKYSGSKPVQGTRSQKHRGKRSTTKSPAPDLKPPAGEPVNGKEKRKVDETLSSSTAYPSGVDVSESETAASLTNERISEVSMVADESARIHDPPKFQRSQPQVVEKEIQAVNKKNAKARNGNRKQPRGPQLQSDAKAKNQTSKPPAVEGKAKSRPTNAKPSMREILTQMNPLTMSADPSSIKESRYGLQSAPQPSSPSGALALINQTDSSADEVLCPPKSPLLKKKNNSVSKQESLNTGQARRKEPKNAEMIGEKQPDRRITNKPAAKSSDSEVAEKELNKLRAQGRASTEPKSAGTQEQPSSKANKDDVDLDGKSSGLTEQYARERLILLVERGCNRQGPGYYCNSCRGLFDDARIYQWKLASVMAAYVMDHTMQDKRFLTRVDGRSEMDSAFQLDRWREYEWYV